MIPYLPEIPSKQNQILPKPLRLPAVHYSAEQVLIVSVNVAHVWHASIDN